MSAITHQVVDDAQKTLGVATCPSGNSGGSLCQMREKAQKWLDSLTVGRLHCWMMWFSVDHQLWPLVWYCLCCIMATLSEFELVLLTFYRKMLLLGGIIGKANQGIQQLDRGFNGMGFPWQNKPTSYSCTIGVIWPSERSCKHPWNFLW